MRIIKVESCWECPYGLVSNNNILEDTMYCERKAGEKIPDCDKIPGWCPLSGLPGKRFNPHWVGEECCCDYQIGNIMLKSVPDSFVMRVTKYRGGYGFAKGNVDEFISKCNLEISYNSSFVPKT